MVISYEVRCSDLDENGDYDTELFEYEVNYRKLDNAIVDIIYNDYFKGTVADVKKFKEQLKDLMSYLDIDCIDEYFEDELKDYFEEEAFNSFN